MTTRCCLLYTDNSLPAAIWDACQRQLRRCLAVHALPIVTVSLEPVSFGRNIVLRGRRGPESMFRQILRGLENTDAEIVYLVEHDVLYHSSHFDFEPSGAAFWYNRSQWHVDSETGRAVHFHHDDPSQLVARRDVLLAHYERVVERVERDGYHSAWGFSPPKGLPAEDRLGLVEHWTAAVPNVDIRHPGCLTRSQWNPSDFRNPAGCRGWTEADEVPGWGRAKGRFVEWLAEVTRAPA